MKKILIMMLVGSLQAYAGELKLGNYVEMQEALAADDFNKALVAHKKICDLNGTSLKKEYADCGKKFKNIEVLRTAFKKLSDVYLAKADKTEMKSLIKVHCPMYPGTWLQKPGKVANPYYGKGMLECGEKI